MDSEKCRISEIRIEELTRLLQETAEPPFWVRLRQLLAEKGIDSKTSLLADCFQDDNSFEFGIVVTRERTVFQFGFDYLHRKVDEGLLGTSSTS